MPIANYMQLIFRMLRKKNPTVVLIVENQVGSKGVDSYGKQELVESIVMCISFTVSQLKLLSIVKNGLKNVLFLGFLCSRYFTTNFLIVIMQCSTIDHKIHHLLHSH